MVAMHFSIMFWNVQGASSPNFRRAFKTVTHSYLPSMVVLMEPRCSGKKANEFILASGFGWSHRIEARGYAGGIWILWKDNFNVVILKNHRQYVHLRVDDGAGSFSYITTVYASLVPSIRKHLWQELKDIADGMNNPWLLMGILTHFFTHLKRKVNQSVTLRAACCFESG